MKNISALEKQLIAYQGDDSEAAKNKVQQIQMELEDARQALEETEMDRNIQEREQLLQNLTLEYETWMNQRLDNEDELLSQIIGSIATEGDEINETLQEIVDKNGTVMSDTITSIFDADTPFTSGLTGISDGVAGTTTAVNNLIAEVQGIAGVLGAPSTDSGSTSKNEGGNTNPSTSGDKVNPTTGSSSATDDSDDIFIKKKNYAKNLNPETSVVDRLKKNDFDSSFKARAIYYSKLGGTGVYKGSAAQNNWLMKKLKERGYKKGSSNIPYDQMSWVHDDEIVLKRLSDGGYLEHLTAGSQVFTAEQVENMRKWSETNPISFAHNISTPSVPAMQNRQMYNQDVTINMGGITMNGVNDPEKFTQDIRRVLATDSRTEKILECKTAGKILGKPDTSRFYI